MSYLLEILGRGLLAELSAAFRSLLSDEADVATSELLDACRESPDDPWVHGRLGARRLADGDLSGARSSFLLALERDTGDLRAHAGLACTYDELGRTESALDQLQTAMIHYPNDATVQFAAGFCLEKLGRCQEAADAYRQSLEIAPNLRNAHERLAAVHLKQDNVTAAIEHCEHICFHEPGDLAYQIMLANLYVRAKQYDDAIRCYRVALTLDPDSWETQDDLVTACDKAGLYHDAIDHLQQMIRERPAAADSYLRLGDLYAKVGRDEQALEAYLESSNTNPDYLEATIKVGTSYLRKGSYIDAARWFNRATEINDRLLNAYVGLGVAQHESGQYDEAADSFEMAAGVEPNSSLLFSEMARLQLRGSTARQADKYLSPQTLTAVLPGPAETDLSPVGDLIAQQIERYQRAIKEHPNYADLHYQLGLLLRHSGRDDDAISAFGKALTINPGYEKALTKLGLLQHEAGHSEQAIDTLKRALTLDSHSADLHYHLGLIFADRYRFDLALEQFEHAARREPENPEFRASLALALQNMGLIDRADASWQVLCDVALQTEEGHQIIAEATQH